MVVKLVAKTAVMMVGSKVTNAVDLKVVMWVWLLVGCSVVKMVECSVVCLGCVLVGWTVGLLVERLVVYLAAHWEVKKVVHWVGQWDLRLRQKLK